MLEMETVPSSLVPHGQAKLIGTRPVRDIIDIYQRDYQVDVSEYFAGMQHVSLYECCETGFQFFHPFSLTGKDSLYEQLGKFPWFYQDDKWEHAVTLERLQRGQKILDIGCGTGNFLAAANNLTGTANVGIELNSHSKEIALQRGLQVSGELIDVHAQRFPEHYDVVTTFQVLEHIPDVSAFLHNCLKVLKTGGLFVVGVPNNDGFLKFATEAVLNGPPHHMGLWTRQSLKALTRFFPLQVLAVEIEPLRELAWYQYVMEQRYLPQRWMRTLYYRFGGANVFKRYISENAPSIAGHTIMAVYRKTAT